MQGMLTEREQGMRTEHSGASAKEKPLLLTERVQQMRAERVLQQAAAEKRCLQKEPEVRKRREFRVRTG